MSKTELSRMTWKEAQEALRPGRVFLLPMGSVEEHGPTAPVGDYRYADEISRRIAAATGAVSLPVIPWGCSDNFRSFPGTLTLSIRTQTELISELADCVLEHGCDHLMFVCGHRGNLPVLADVGRRIRRERRLCVASIEPLAWVTPQFAAEVYGEPQPFIGHGSEPLQSIGMYLFPEDIRSDLREEGHRPSFGGLRIQGMANAMLDGHPVQVYLGMDEITPNGVIGDARLGSAEAGRRIVEHLVDIGVRAVRWFAGVDTRRP